MMVCGSAVLASVRKNGNDDPEFIRDYSIIKSALLKEYKEWYDQYKYDVCDRW